MKIVYHTDDDGRCAATIVYHELKNPFEPFNTETDFIQYSHTGVIDVPEIKENELIYIVDLSLDRVIFDNIIKPGVEVNARIVHIDHHKTTFDFMSNMTPAEKAIFENITYFYKQGLSGTMLTWIYANMTDDERNNPMTIEFDFTDKFTHFAFYPETPDMREYHIPDVIRYIDDNDVWRHDLENTKYFNVAFSMEENKHPASEIWDNLVYSSTQRNVEILVNKGKMLWDYQTSLNQKGLINSFEHEIEGIKTLCLNVAAGNSRVFCEKFDEYPMVCKFAYDGSVGKWRYTFYSSENNENWVDVSTIATKFGGGGHAHAAGCVTDYLIFEGIDNYDHI